MLVYWSVTIYSESFTSISGTFIAQETHPRSTPKFHPLKSPGHFRPWFFNGFNAKKIVLQMCKERMRLVQRNRRLEMKTSCKWTLTNFLFRKRKPHLCEEGKLSFLNSPTKNRVSETSISQIFLFLKCWASHCFHPKKLICFPPIWAGNHATAEYLLFRLQKLLSELKLQEILQRNWQQIQNPGGFSRWHGVFLGDTNDGARTGFLFHPSFCLVVFFGFFSNKKTGIFCL